MNTPLNSTLVDNPSLWRLSLLIGEKGIDAVARRQVGEPEHISAYIPFDSAAASVSSALEEAVYSNPLLLQPFAKTDIVISGGFTLVMPVDASLDDVDSIFPSSGESVSLSAPIDSRNKLIFRIDRGVANFLRRTFDNATPIHALAVLGQYFSHRSRLGNSSKMYADIGVSGMNILVYNPLGLAMANTFNCPSIKDAAYFALASANTADFDFTEDEIRVAGNAERRGELMTVLRKFARNVVPAIIPAGAVNGDSSLLAAPFTLLILPLCE